MCLGFALASASAAPLGTIASESTPEAEPAAAEQGSSPITGLPNYDIRDAWLAGEAPATPPAKAAAAAKAEGRDRFAAVERFRAALPEPARESLKVELNEAGVPKVFFNYDAPLAEARDGSPDRIARSFLADHADVFGLSRREVRTLKLEGDHESGGVTFLNYEQTIRGVTVFHGHVQVVVTARGEVVSVNEGMIVPGGRVDPTPALDEAEAIGKAFEYAGREAPAGLEVLEPRSARGDRSVFANPLGEQYEPVLSDLRVLLTADGPVLAWHAFVDVGSGEWYEILVDANTGELLFRYNLYAHAAQGTVYTNNPTRTPTRTLQSFVGDTTINTSAGWMGASTVTTGNNVDAYLDVDANNSPDPNNTAGLSNGRASASNQDFTFSFSTGSDPRGFKPAVVTNLFYFNNVMHDRMYALGFTESAGNFQSNNYGRGGAGNDPVNAEAQDGSGTNNANFATPPDGSRPRMQQYLFTMGTSTTADDRDSSLDGDVVFHEYGHGVSNRLVGGPSNVSCLGGVQSGAMGEGWGDYWACSYYNDGVMGEYVTNNGTRGIRRAGYAVPANTVHDSYADVGNQGFQVHNDGEIWCATLWDLNRTLGGAVVDRLVLEGMKYTPCRPSMLNARDGILQADQNLNGGANRCQIWTVFARHGMGYSATGNDGTTHNAATNLPPDCGGGGGPTPTPIACGQTLSGSLSTTDPRSTVRTSMYADSYTFTGTAGTAVTITMTSGAFDTWLVLKSPSGTVVAQDDDGNGGTNSRIAYTPTASGTFTIEATSYSANATGSYSIALACGGGGGGGATLINEGAESGASGWTVSTSGSAWGIETSGSSHSGARRFKTNVGLSTYANNTNSSLISPVFSLAGRSSATLTFYYKHSTESGYDYFRVEVSSNGGSTWTQLTARSGNSPGWDAWAPQASYNLTPYVGSSNCRIRFRLTTDQSVTGWGVAVDDIVVTAQ
jgi:hypothetical protein